MEAGAIETGVKQLFKRCECSRIKQLSVVPGPRQRHQPMVAGCQDGIGEQEARALEELSYLSRKNEGQASRIVDMPFLETLEPPDVSALSSLVDMAWFRQADYQRVLSHPTLSDGITDDWAKIVSTLYGVSKK